MSEQFDLIAHHRARTRRAEARAALLEAHRGRLERLLLLALHVATAAGEECDPLDLLNILELVVDQEEQAEAETRRLVDVLRETDPARIPKSTAA